jgi:hypothetical protein
MKVILNDLPKTPESKMLFNKTFIDNGIMALGFGIIYAVLITPNQFKESAHLDIEIYGYVSFKNVKRLLVIGGLAGCLYILLKLISGVSVYLQFFLKM